MMTRKDYVKVSEILHANSEGVKGEAYLSLITDLAEYMKEDNPRFDSQRFIDACIVGK